MITLYLKQYNKIIRNADVALIKTLRVEDVLWIDLLNPTFKEQKVVENFMGVSLQSRQQIEEIETTSKYSETKSSIISNSNFFIPQEDNFTIEPVSLIITEGEALISMRTAEMRTFRDAERRLQITPKNYPTGYHIFTTLLDVRIDYDADLVEVTAKMVAALSRDIAQEDNIDKEFIRRIGQLQENTMMLRENIFDRQRVLWMILRSDRFPAALNPRFQLMVKDVNSLISHADFAFQRLDYIQASALGLINIEQNEIVKIFSVASVIFMPATLIASIYGMNFKFMPELSWAYELESGLTIPLGYMFAIFLMLLCSGFTIWFFRYKKWL
ncbi:MAG: CorA family divalent cation transporter [Rikenellaceae bacterium]